MKSIWKKLQFNIIILSGCLLVPLVAFADTGVTLLNASGGPGGSPFVDMAGEIAAITVRSGSLIDSIQISYRYGNKRVIGLAHGGRGGKSSTFKLKAGEVITELGGRSGKFVDSLYIKTSKNRFKKWGGPGGKDFRFKGSKQSPIMGIWGRSGNLLDAIGAVKVGKGGQSITTNGFGTYEEKMNKPGVDDAKSDSIQELQFPGPAAQTKDLRYWLQTHNTQLGNIIRKLSGSQTEFKKYLEGEKKTCQSSLYCEVAYRRGAISHVTGAE